jgi:hypothetical protein
MGGHPEECPLVKWNVPGDKSKGTSYIEEAVKSSPGDVRWVRNPMYGLCMKHALTPYNTISGAHQLSIPRTHIHSVENASIQVGKGESRTEKYFWGPYVERSKVTGENLTLLRELDYRREKLVAEEKAAREAAKDAVQGGVQGQT